MVIKAILTAAVGLACIPAAFAQAADTAQSATSAAAATSAAPAAAASATGAPYSDEAVQKYAKALVAVNKVQVDTTVAAADKQAKMFAAVQEAGLDAQTFNQMSQAMQADPALAQRIQAATAAQH
ncbi:MAG: DUF4168 domain-containing protein [Sphingomonadales bacterium]|nr:DUF4168 domain-containing protein [Sphingomonadales bacterium]MDE2171946.1 DUF4168 domain-containing protein [Sphingomonadales bacterium]